MNPLNPEFSKAFWGNDTPTEEIRNDKDHDSIAIPESESNLFHVPDGKIHIPDGTINLDL